jgi:hypothetical protein
MKIRAVGAELLIVEERTGMAKVISRFSQNGERV